MSISRSASAAVLPCLLALLVASVCGAQVDVRIMPGFPNAPNQSPLQRTAVRPGTPFLVWGNALGATGATYTWSFSPNPDVQVVDDGSLTGTVTDDTFIFEEVTFNLLGGSTREVIDATLTVDDGMGGVDSRFVGLVIIDPTDPLSDTPLEALGIDVNIAIQGGLRWLYANQNSNGSWSTSTIAGSRPCAGAAFAVWALQNQGHVATNDPDEDIFADTVRKGLEFIFDQAVVGTDVSAPRSPTMTSDLNGNGQWVNLCPGSDAGYSTPIAAAAVIASSAPTEVVNQPSSALNGMTYKEIVEDVVDWAGHTQNANDGFGGVGRGGWNYNPTNNQTRSDMSINSWFYVAMEGAIEVFQIAVPDWIKEESEHTLVSHQSNAAGSGFGYTGTSACTGANDHRMATTGGGLSGLVLVETEQAPIAQVIAGAPAPLNTVAAKRQAALDYLGQFWGSSNFNPGAYCRGNRGNYYVMWTVARALRLTADALGLPQGQNVQLQNGGVSFDWATGEEGGSGMLAGTNTAREGYFPWLVRQQQTTGAPQDRGRWQDNTYVGTTLETAMAVLILTPRVFLPSNTPPEIVVVHGGQPQQCPATIPASESVPVTFDLVVTDIDPGDMLTLTASGVPAGATHTPSLPATGTSPLTVTFNWVPPTMAATFTVTYTADDGQGGVTTCTVDIQVGTCLLIQGWAPDYIPLGANVNLFLQPDAWWPVTMTEVPTFVIPDTPEVLGVRTWFQVFMHNPYVFPGNPMQVSPALEITVGASTHPQVGSGDILIWPVGTFQPGHDVTIGFDVFANNP